MYHVIKHGVNYVGASYKGVDSNDETLEFHTLAAAVNSLTRIDASNSTGWQIYNSETRKLEYTESIKYIPTVDKRVLILHNLDVKIEIEGGDIAEVEIYDGTSRNILSKIARLLIDKIINEQLCCDTNGDLVNNLSGVFYREIRKLTVEFED